jgi:hypothetical protein
MCVDIVHDVVNTVSMHWAADRLCGIPLKTKENPRGLYTVHEVYDMFTTLFNLSFLGIGKQENGFSLRFDAVQAGGVIQALVAKSIVEISPKSASNPLVTLATQVGSYIWPPAKKPCYAFLSKLADTGRPVNQLVATTVGLAIGTSVNFAQSAVHVIDFYLDPKREKEYIQILQLIHKTDERSAELLRGYVREGMRLNPQVSRSCFFVFFCDGATDRPLMRCALISIVYWYLAAGHCRRRDPAGWGQGPAQSQNGRSHLW